jgi:hypothetical protein
MTLSNRLNRALAGLGVAGILLLGAVIASPPAAAVAVPFNDPNAQGAIGLCDATGRSIQSGSLLTYPFVAGAASTVAAPAGYGTDAGGHVTVYAFQPRLNVDPGEWSGFQLTGSSVYADAQHPLAVATVLDPALQEFLLAYPAHWNGLLQLRMYYTAPNKVVFRQTYPAAVLQAKAGRWTVLQGASMRCDLSKAVSGEKLNLPASYFNPVHPGVSHAPGTVPSSVASAAKGVLPPVQATPPSSTHPTAPPTPLPSRSTAASNANRAQPVADATAKKSTASAPWIFVLISVAIGTAGLLVLRSRRRRVSR